LKWLHAALVKTSEKSRKFQFEYLSKTDLGMTIQFLLAYYLTPSFNITIYLLAVLKYGPVSSTNILDVGVLLNIIT